MLEIKSLCLKYDEFTALDDINLTINKGEVFGIIGMSGAGKTSLIRCLCGLEMPVSGSINIDNKNLNNLNNKDKRALSNDIGVVFQGYNLLMQKNIFNNIALPLSIQQLDKSYIQKKVMELLDLVDLKDKAYTYPSKLSGGQKQRVAIARALASNPKILLLDEITSALDPLNTKAIIQLLKQINKESDVTIILITHEINIVKLLCERMCVIDEGKIIEIGHVKEIFENPKYNITKLLLGKEDL